MTTKSDGGPAFPVADWDHQTFQPRTIEETRRLLSGMTLRDYFAAQVMQALISKHGGYIDDAAAWGIPRGLTEDAPNVDEVAQYAYTQADAMLKAREL